MNDIFYVFLIVVAVAMFVLMFVCVRKEKELSGTSAAKKIRFDVPLVTR